MRIFFKDGFMIPVEGWFKKISAKDHIFVGVQFKDQNKKLLKMTKNSENLRM